MTEEPREPVQPEQTQEPTQSVEDTMRRLAGIPKTPEELEAEREANEKERLERGRVPGPLGNPDHPHGGPPGQTGEHPLGGPPGQTGEHPEGGPPPQVNQGPAEPPEAEPKA